MQRPSVNNPLVLTIVNPNDQGVIPSMKNARKPYISYRDGKAVIGIRKDAKVVRFEKVVDDLIATQTMHMPFVLPIEMPCRVAVVARIYRLASQSSQVPIQDLDNQYTTLQEALQRCRIIENDRQVAGFFCYETLVSIPSAQHAIIWLWVVDNIDVKKEISEFLNNYLTKYENNNIINLNDLKQLELPFNVED